MSDFLKNYVSELRNKGKEDMASSIQRTAEIFTKEHLDDFSFTTHEIGLLFGNVQAGKTAQMFGIMCVAADKSFPLFILLTTDNVALQTQTYNRVKSELEGCGFCICGEMDKQKFIDNELMKPTIVVLKKNSKVLLQWHNTLISSSFVLGNPLFIVDDEADAASPNTLVNKKKISTINSRLMNIKKASIGSIYLQVTGTPQALLLQATNSEFKPSFITYFQPGKEYLGGNFFFGEDKSMIHFIDNDNKLKDGLYYALIHHITVSSCLFLNKEKVCNFVIHPGITKNSHLKAEKNIKEKITFLEKIIDTEEFLKDIKDCWDELHPLKIQKRDFEDVLKKAKDIVGNKEIKILIMNGDNNVEDTQYETGSNIIIGGNVLGRGVTFSKLQTLYYTRTAKKPQADTMWQHSRMFGYDRDAGLMKVYLTKDLYKLFSNINSVNNSVIAQAEKGIDKIQLLYPTGLNPTRKNVIDIRMVDIIPGGMNYYPSNPFNLQKDDLDYMMKRFPNTGYQQVGVKIISEILNYIDSEEDSNLVAYKEAIKTIISNNPLEQGVLIVRTGRAVTQGTGSLLSPNDRELGNEFKSKVVLTMYQIDDDLGWKQKNIWVPNIKLPEFINYYNVK